MPMHIRQLGIKNLRAIKDLELRFGKGNCAGWHVLLGDNGAGKSTVVRALATALMGAVNAHASRQNWSTWLREHEDEGSIEILLEQHPRLDRWAGQGNTAAKALIRASVTFSREQDNAGSARPAPVSIGFPRHGYALRTLWGRGVGWFSASFGPFRRFTGGDPDVISLYFSHPRLAAHLTALGEHVALGESLRWLKELQTRALERDLHARRIRDAVVDFLNGAELFPHAARISEVSSERVTMTDGDGAEVAMEEMSDGYRSILSMTLELLRLMFDTLGVDAGLRAIAEGKVRLPGVVAIDEVDAHLHPQWQKRIGEWFVERFPETQFIVTTHSPIICRAAAHGSVWMLPKPGSSESPRRVTGKELDRLVDGNILEAMSTDLFGEDVIQSKRSQAKMARLAQLGQKQLHAILSETEEAELQSLRATFPTTPNGALG